MSLSSRIAWTEGLFLRPQHFQQEGRYRDRVQQLVLGAVSDRLWGFSQLTLNTDILGLGKVGIAQARGLFPDGEPFDFPGHDVVPDPVSIDKDAHGCRVFLTLAVRQPGQSETSQSGEGTRSRSEVSQVPDTMTEGRTDAASLEISRLRPQLRVERKPGEGVDGLMTLGIARVADIGSDGGVRLDPAYLPALLRYGTHDALSGYVSNTLGLLEGRAETLASRVTGTSGAGAPEVSDYILLQTVNRYLSLFRNLSADPGRHPEDVYAVASELCAEFATYTQPDRVAPGLEPYNHAEPGDAFRAVMDETRRSLAFIGDPTAARLTLTDRGYGIRVHEIADKSALRSARLVLAVGASMPGEDLREEFPMQVKIGAVEVIRDLVTVQIPGVRVEALPVAPRQIPYHAGRVYFEIERKGEYWDGILSSSGLAVHVADQFPDLDLTLWSIRETRR